MTRRVPFFLALLASGSASLSLGACGNGSAAPSMPDASGGHDALADGTKDTGSRQDAGNDQGSPDVLVEADTGQEATAPSLAVIGTFDKSMGQLPEGLWEISPDAKEFLGTTGTPITAWAATATPVTVSPDGGATTFGALGSGAAQSTYTLGVTTDTAKNVYFAVAAAAAPPNDPAPGIYRFPAGGGTASVFSLGSAASPPMNFANGLDFIGPDLFVADSEGVVYKVDAAGAAAVWSDDPLLAPDTTACAGKVPLPIGANGIVHDAKNVYVTNTDFGRIVEIPIRADGSAGTASVLKEDCATLVGADGLLIDPKDGSFIVALNILNQIVRVSHDGATVTVLASGSPLNNPASPILDTAGGKRRLLVTNPGFFTGADAGPSNLIELSLP